MKKETDELNEKILESARSEFLAYGYQDASLRRICRAAFNVEAMSQVTPAWDNAASNEEKLEKIITQKWIACYPEGCEAWAEQRRTGYPKLFPVLVNDSQGTIDTNLGPRRLNFFVGIQTANPEQYAALTKALGGADNCGTRLWWDTGRNF